MEAAGNGPGGPAIVDDDPDEFKRMRCRAPGQRARDWGDWSDAAAATAQHPAGKVGVSAGAKTL